MASDVQVAIAQGCALGHCLVKMFPFSSYMGSGESKALSYARCYSSCPEPSCRCQATHGSHADRYPQVRKGCKTEAAVKAGMSVPQPVNQYHLHSVHQKQI